jgi:type VI secretion system secreted protein Hcp
MKAIQLLLAAALFTTGFICRSSAESFDILLLIEPLAGAPTIVGESAIEGHEGEIDVASFKMGVAQKGSALAGGSGFGASKSDFKPLTIYKFIDKATPQLFLACATGTRYKRAVLTVTNSGNARLAPPERRFGEFFKLVIEDVFITSMNQDASTTDGNGNLVESVEISYQRISWFYTAADGSTTSGGFDLKKNAKFTPPVAPSL